MTKSQLDHIHGKMLTMIERNGGFIDRIYVCPKLVHDKPNCRKPDSFMALQAKNDFSDIDFNRSFMIGDQVSDIEFGKRLNMKCVWIPEAEGLEWIKNKSFPDYIFNDLYTFALEFSNEYYGTKV